LVWDPELFNKKPEELKDRMELFRESLKFLSEKTFLRQALQETRA